MKESNATVEQWFDEGVKRGHRMMHVLCDTFNYEQYPVYDRLPDESLGEMQRIEECYTLSEPFESQLLKNRRPPYSRTPSTYARHYKSCRLMPNEKPDGLKAIELVTAELKKLGVDFGRSVRLVSHEETVSIPSWASSFQGNFGNGGNGWTNYGIKIIVDGVELHDMYDTRLVTLAPHVAATEMMAAIVRHLLTRKEQTTEDNTD